MATMNRATLTTADFVFDVGTADQPLWLVSDYDDDTGQYRAKTDPRKVGLDGPREAFSTNRRSLISSCYTFRNHDAALARAAGLYVGDVRAHAIPLADAAERIGITLDSLRQAIHRDSLSAFKIGRNWVVTPDEVDRYHDAIYARMPSTRRTRVGKGTRP